MGHHSDRDGLRGNLYAVDVPAVIDALDDHVRPEDAGELMGVAVLVVGW